MTALALTDKIGLTVSQSPTFLAYIPQSTATTGEFILIDENNQLIYRNSFAVPSTSGIASINLPSDKSLESGKTYEWYLVLICNPTDRSGDEVSNPGWVQIGNPSDNLVGQLKTAKPLDIPNFYANDGIWYEALASLAELRRNDPNNSKLLNDWDNLLTSVNLQPFIKEPLVNCCQLETQTTQSKPITP